MESKSFIYVIICPKTNKIRYVGQTKRGIRRFYEHASKYKQRNTAINNWLTKKKLEGLKPEFLIVDYVPEEELNFWEQHWIELCKCWGFNLLNLTAGGNMNLISENHNSKFLKGKKLEDYYSDERVSEIKGKISASSSGENNPFYGRTLSKDSIRLMKNKMGKQTTILDTFTEEERVFNCSQDAADYIGCRSGKIRYYKKNGWLVNRRYRIGE